MSPAEKAVVKAYAVRWKDSSLVVEHTDVAFRVSIAGVTCVGEMDACGTEDGERVILELKTTSATISPGSSYWNEKVHTDNQITTYLAAAKALGWGATKVVYDVIRKSLLRQKVNETDEDFEVRILSDIADDPDKYFRRAVMVRMDHEHEAFVRDLVGHVRLMQFVQTLPETPRNTSSCFTFHRPCDFFDVCSGSAEIGDVSRFQDSEYRKEKPNPVVEKKNGYTF